MLSLKQYLEETRRIEKVQIPLSLQIYELDGITYAKASSMGPIPQGATLTKTIPIVKGG